MAEQKANNRDITHDVTTQELIDIRIKAVELSLMAQRSGCELDVEQLVRFVLTGNQ